MRPWSSSSIPPERPLYYGIKDLIIMIFDLIKVNLSIPATDAIQKKAEKMIVAGSFMVAVQLNSSSH